MALPVLKYVELKSGHGDSGPAWIGYAQLSRSGQTVYFNGKALKRAKGGGISGNYFDIETGEEYWVSGVKKNGQDRHWAGSGIVMVEAAALAEYLSVTGLPFLNPKTHSVIEALAPTDPANFLQLENEKLN